MAEPSSETTGDSSPPNKTESSALRQVLGLFVVPLLVVILCVSVFVGFGWIAYDRHSVRDYLNDIRDPRQIFAHRRKQAAYELSKILSGNPEALKEEPGAGRQLRQLFEKTDDLWVRRYLALVLGHTGDREALPLLLKAMEDDDSQTRIYAIWALGAIGDTAASDPLVAVLRDSDSGIRKTAAFALGGVGPPSVAGSLEPLLNDSMADVRWNAALALAQLGSRAGIPVLERMLDRSLLAQVPEITPQQQEEAMVSAVEALTRLRHFDTAEGRSTVERLAAEDPSLKVRQAAIEARKSWARK